MREQNLTSERLARVRIARTAGVGPVTFARALAKFGSAAEACGNWPEGRGKIGPLRSEDEIRREIDILYKSGGTLLVLGDADYPAQLAALPDAPVVLSVLGDASHLAKRQVAIVGNRSASAAGLAWSKQLAGDLARAGVGVTSGLARGIDTAAHSGALEAGGVTIAVVAGGVDHVYPPENAGLREAIMRNGCVVSEQAWGMAPTASLFPRRNRIIAGLSVGVAVSEATRHSGSLITAECALNYGREVWAVPGSPGDPRSGGPNWLLKQGATLIEGAADILDGLPQAPAPYVPHAAQRDLFEAGTEAVVDEDEVIDVGNVTPVQRVFGLLGRVPVAFDELVRQAAMDEAGLNALLIEMELDGHAVREADGRWRRG